VLNLIATTEGPSLTRQCWLELSATALRKRFIACGYEVPDNVRVSIGWPKGSHGKGGAIGQCWFSECLSDQYNEIFVSPELGGETSPVKIIGVLAHEMAHAVAGKEAGHVRRLNASQRPSVSRAR
jgi:hypothetical protein